MKSLFLVLVAVLFAVPSFADLYVSPTFVTFGHTKVGDHFYHQRTVSVQNRGEKPAQVNVQGFCSTHFRVQNNCYTLSKYGSCQINIVYRPTLKGSHSCNISVRSQTGGLTNVNISGSAY